MRRTPVPVRMLPGGGLRGDTLLGDVTVGEALADAGLLALAL